LVGFPKTVLELASRLLRLWCSVAVLNPSITGSHLMKKQQGFSLIELLIVVAIILIIAAIAIPNLLKSNMAANESSAVSSVRTLNTGEVVYDVSCRPLLIQRHSLNSTPERFAQAARASLTTFCPPASRAATRLPTPRRPLSVSTQPTRPSPYPRRWARPVSAGSIPTRRA
jgi:prepilin-type N-terminal cleavage/methylation domain-containing protein